MFGHVSPPDDDNDWTEENHWLDDEDLSTMFCELKHFGYFSVRCREVHQRDGHIDNISWWDGYLVRAPLHRPSINHEVEPTWSNAWGWVLPALELLSPAVVAELDSDYSDSDSDGLFSASDSSLEADTEDDLSMELE